MVMPHGATRLSGGVHRDRGPHPLVHDGLGTTVWPDLIQAIGNTNDSKGRLVVEVGLSATVHYDQ